MALNHSAFKLPERDYKTRPPSKHEINHSTQGRSSAMHEPMLLAIPIGNSVIAQFKVKILYWFCHCVPPKALEGGKKRHMLGVDSFIQK